MRKFQGSKMNKVILEERKNVRLKIRSYEIK